jgi:hypothetical protein
MQGFRPTNMNRGNHSKPPLSARKAGDDPFGCRCYRPHPTSWKPPCSEWQVGEVAPAPRLDVLRNMVGGGRESKSMHHPNQNPHQNSRGHNRNWLTEKMARMRRFEPLVLLRHELLW